MDEPVPVTIVTGWHAHRTGDLIDHLLGHLSSCPVAVLGGRSCVASSTPSFFVEVEAEVSEQSAGCPCCAIRSDIVRVVANLTSRVRPPEWILIEAAGWTDAVVAGQTFFHDPGMARVARLDGIVTVVDGPATAARLEAGDAPWPDVLASDQVAMADRIVVSGVGSMTIEASAAAAQAASATNGSAGLVVSLGGEVEPAQVLGLDAFGPDGAAASSRRPRRPMGFGVVASDSAAHVVEAAGVLDQARLEAWLDALHESRDHRLLRLDGVLALRGRDRQLICQGIGSMLNRWRGPRFAPGEERRSRLVVTGRNLDAGQLQSSLADCVAS